FKKSLNSFKFLFSSRNCAISFKLLSCSNLYVSQSFLYLLRSRIILCISLITIYSSSSKCGLSSQHLSHSFQDVWVAFATLTHILCLYLLFHLVWRDSFPFSFCML